MRAMIDISDSAQAYFRRLLQSQGGDAVGIRLSASDPGTPRADARLEFCEDGDLLGDEWAVECAGFVLYVDVWLRFGGGCHGCGMADMTLKQGIEKTLMAKVPGVTAVRDATDHSTGEAPYMARA